MMWPSLRCQVPPWSQIIAGKCWNRQLPAFLPTVWDKLWPLTLAPSPLWALAERRKETKVGGPRTIHPGLPQFNNIQKKGQEGDISGNKHLANQDPAHTGRPAHQHSGARAKACCLPASAWAPIVLSHWLRGPGQVATSSSLWVQMRALYSHWTTQRGSSESEDSRWPLGRLYKRVPCVRAKPGP